MAKVIQMLVNNESTPTLEAKESRDKIAKSISRRIIESLESDPAAWLASRMPALVGPHQGRPWVKALRNLSQPNTEATRL